MKKNLFAIVACCFAVNAVFAQVPSEISLSEEKPQDEIHISDKNNNLEYGRIFIRMMDEPNNQGNTPVRIELQNTSDVYDFLICDHAWDKKELRKSSIIIDKGYTGESTQSVKNIGLKGSIIIPSNSDEKHIFPNVYVGEGQEEVIRIPIHLVKPKPGLSGLFCKKRKKLCDVIHYTLRITVNTRDRVYENLQMEYDSLFNAFHAALDREEFCANPKHGISLEDQAVDYFNERQELENKVGAYYEKCSPKSKKFGRYEALYDSVHEMRQKMEKDLEEYKHDCGGHKSTASTSSSCRYCTLSLEEISKRMQNLYFDLYNEKKERAEVQREARSLYNCCINHKKQDRQWNNSEYKKTIVDYYNNIKDY